MLALCVQPEACRCAKAVNAQQQTLLPYHRHKGLFPYPEVGHLLLLLLQGLSPSTVDFVLHPYKPLLTAQSSFPFGWPLAEWLSGLGCHHSSEAVNPKMSSPMHGMLCRLCMQHSQKPQAHSHGQYWLTKRRRSCQAGFGDRCSMHTWSAAAFFCRPSQLALSLASSAVSLLSCLLSSDSRAASSAPTSTAACSGNVRMQRVMLSNHSRAPPQTTCQP